MSIHSHTMYSPLDGIGDPKEHVEAAIEVGLPGLAISDHGLNSGWYHMEKEARAGGINFIPGVESYFTPNRHIKDRGEGFGDKPAHLLLIGTSVKGVQNLYRIISSSYIEGFYGKPRADWDLLENFNEDIIATSGCVGGPVGRYIRANDYDRARNWIVRMREIFGDRFYLELQPHPFEEQEELNRFLMTITDIPKVVTNDSHYPVPESAGIQQISACIATKSTFRDPAIVYEHDFSVKSLDKIHSELGDMGFSGSEIDDALDNTLFLLKTIDVELPRGKSLTPGWQNAQKDLEEHLRDGWNRKIKPYYRGEKKRAYLERLRYEYDLICTKGFAEYFLVVEDMIKAAKDMGVMVGVGRGSSGGSLMSYLLDITEIDPLKWDLPMERFMSPHRGGWKMTFHEHKFVTEMVEWYWQEVGKLVA